jgi:benzodiazapine receptor
MHTAPPLETRRRPSAGLALLGWLGLCLLVAIVSGVLTAPAIPTWYAQLTKPALNPPNQVFGPVWTVLYILMGVAAWMLWKAPSSSRRSIALMLFCFQLALNFLWSLIFFRLHHIGLALVELAALWIAILTATIAASKVRRAAAGLLLPYLAWVTFAAYLNYGLWLRN